MFDKRQRRCRSYRVYAPSGVLPCRHIYGPGDHQERSARQGRIKYVVAQAAEGLFTYRYREERPGNGKP